MCAMAAQPNGQSTAAAGAAAAVTQVMLVDSQEILRLSLRLLLNSRAGVRVVAEAASVVAATQRLPPPDVFLVHTPVLAGQETADIAPLRELPALAARAPVLILTGKRELELHYRMYGEIINHGVQGIVFREAASETLFQAIATLRAGGVWLGPSTLARVLGKMLQVKHTQITDPERRKVARLTQREREIIVLLCQGRKNKQIAQQLHLSEATVRHYLTAIFGKLAVTDRLELAIYAYRHGLHLLPWAEPATPDETPPD